MAPSDVAFVVKGNAYGHGLPTVVPAAMAAGQRTFCTFSAAEAERVRRHGPGARIIVMGHIDSADIPWASKHNVELYAHAHHAFQAMQEAEAPLRVHLEVETGMHRTGMQPEHALDAARAMADDPYLQHVGTCTHLAGAESLANMPRIDAQVQRFHDFVDALKDHGISPGTRHIASSSAALLRPELRLDMVRLGIAMYGTWPTRDVQANCREAWEPRPAMAWRSRVMDVHKVGDGAYIGYGKHAAAEGETMVAIVPVGYADGFARGLSENGCVLIRGDRHPIIGMVNMNMLQVDVTGTQVEEGDEVVLIGNQGDQRIGVHSFAEDHDMVNYELMTRLGQHLPRRG